MTNQENPLSDDHKKNGQERFFDNQSHQNHERSTHSIINNKNHEMVSLIYYQKKDSPKYFEIRKSAFFWWFVVLPAITLCSLVLVVMTLIHFSPTHLIQNYLSAKNYESMKSTIEQLTNENLQLKEQLNDNKEALKIELAKNSDTVFPESVSNANIPSVDLDSKTTTKEPIAQNIDPTNGQKPSMAEGFKGKETGTLNLSYLSLFKPVQGQKDRTRPAQISLSGFNVVSLRDTISLKFNITPLTPRDQKIAGHILVIMKGETGLQVYPQMSLNAPESQISFSAGEPFATQRFRPVDASFLKPRKSGQFVFTVLIFAKNGDLIHTQTVPLFVRL